MQKKNWGPLKGRKKKKKAEAEIPAVKLYSLRGELIGELSPGGKVDFNTLLNRDRYKKSFNKKGW